MKRYLAALAVLLITGWVVSCVGGGCLGPEGPRGVGLMMHYGFGGMFMGIIFLIVIGLLVYFIVQAHKTKSQIPTQHESPLDILKRRYAKGEITKEEFERMKKDLEG